MKEKIEKEERLLTEKEREYIIECYNKIKWSDMAIVLGVGLIVYLLVSLLWGFAWCGMSKGIAMVLKQGSYCFLGMICFTGLMLTSHLSALYTVTKKAKANTLYAKEAIYDMTSGKYHRVYLDMYKKGKMKYDGYTNLLVREPLQKGDKVIVLKMRGQAWVYKARD